MNFIINTILLIGSIFYILTLPKSFINLFKSEEQQKLEFNKKMEEWYKPIDIENKVIILNPEKESREAFKQHIKICYFINSFVCIYIISSMIYIPNKFFHLLAACLLFNNLLLFIDIKKMLKKEEFKPSNIIYKVIIFIYRYSFVGIILYNLLK